jgi:hypothetical protein
VITDVARDRKGKTLKHGGMEELFPKIPSIARDPYRCENHSQQIFLSIGIHPFAKNAQDRDFRKRPSASSVPLRFKILPLLSADR